MKILYKYYRWRASKAKTASGQAHYRRKAYKHSTAFKGYAFFGRDLTFEDYPAAIKAEQTLEPPLKHPEDLRVHTERRFVDRTREEASYARYLKGPIKQGYVDPETKQWVDPNEWQETPLWWAGVEEANEQHMPTRRRINPKVVSYKINPETGRRDYYTYNYSTGKQEKID